MIPLFGPYRARRRLSNGAAALLAVAAVALATSALLVLAFHH